MDGETSVPNLDRLNFESTTVLAHVFDAEVIPVTGDKFGAIGGSMIGILGSLGVIRLPITDDGLAMLGLDNPAERFQD